MKHKLRMNQHGLLAVSAVLFSTSLMASPITLNVTGNVIAAACTVDTTLAGGQQVQLGDVGRTKLQNVGEAGPWKSFSLQLINCPTGTSFSTATFTGTADSSDTTLFANTEPATTAAAQVAVQMADDNNRGTVISNNGSMTVSVDSTAKTAIFPLAARLYTPTGGVQPGSVSATVLVNFTYQ